MERRGVLICGVVGLLGLISAATGFGAEAARIKGSEVELVTPTQCAYPRSPALALGLTAVASLLIAHIIVNVATGCFCCCNFFSMITKTPNFNCGALIACFILSWLTFVLGLFLLLTAAVLNERHGEDTVYYGNYYCYIVKPGVFAGGAVLSLTSILLGIIFFYYFTLTSPSSSSAFSFSNNNNNTISIMAMAMASQPHPLPPDDHETNPVFVHEDTYMRRQFP